MARFGVWASALEATIDDSKAREQLGYEPVITRDHGLTRSRPPPRRVNVNGAGGGEGRRGVDSATRVDRTRGSR